LKKWREAGRILREGDLPFLTYKGFIEGNTIGQGEVDVVVTEGFTGNIALKAAEGTARQLARHLRAEMSRTIWTRLGYLLARSAFPVSGGQDGSRKGQWRPCFLGLNGIVIKSHGNTDAQGFAYAVDIGYDNGASGTARQDRRDVGIGSARSDSSPRRSGKWVAMILRFCCDGFVAAICRAVL